MNMELRQKLEGLDPVKHRFLREALEAKYHLKKDENVRTLSPEKDPFEKMFLDSVNRINEGYPEGTSLFLKENHPRLFNEIIRLEKRLDRIWSRALAGHGALEEFSCVLREWEALNIQGREMHKRERPN